MNKVQKHIKELKDYKAPTMLDGVNKLYFMEVEEKPRMVKIGDTHRDVKTRNEETILNSSLHLTCPTTWVEAKKWDNSVFRDKKFHKFLEDKGYKREINQNGKKSEWFFITRKKARQLLAEFIRKPVFDVPVYRTAQHYILDQLRKAHKEGYQYICAGLCVRVGKTIISLTDSSEQNCMPIYIGKNLTSQSSADKDNAKFGIVPEMLTQSIHGVDEYTDGELSKKVKKIIKNINEKNVNDKLIALFVDEVSDQSHTKKSRAIITQVVDALKAEGKFAFIVTMSGDRIHRGMKVLKELTDGEIKEISLEYYEMQILQPDTTCERNYRHISFYSDSADGLANISDSLKNEDTGHKSLSTFMKKILGTNNYQFTVDPKFPHWFLKFSAAGKGKMNRYVSYLNKNCAVIENVEYHYQAVNGDFTSNREAEDFAYKIINKHPGKRVVFITQGMATTSFSVPEIGNSLVFTDNPLTSDDIQALHRSATWVQGKIGCNMIVVTTNNSAELTFDDPFEEETKVATTREERETIYRELLNNNSMIHIADNLGTSVRPVKITKDNVANMLDEKQKTMTRVASIMNVVNELDEEIIEDIVNTVDGKINGAQDSKSTKGDVFDPFGTNGKDKEQDKDQSNSDKLTATERSKKLRIFVEKSINVPAVAREQKTTIKNFEYWNEIGMSETLFYKVYTNSTMFKDRIDSIYNLCKEKDYLVKNYIDRLTS